jgi:hypothetical protein
VTIFRVTALVFLFAFVQAHAANLAIANWKLQDYEDGSLVSKNQVFEAGQTVHLSFQISGFKNVEDHIHLSYEIGTTDPSNRPLTPVKTGEIDTDLAPEDKRWLPKVRYQVQIPPLPEPGTYKIQVRVTDQVAGGATAVASADFAVGGKSVEAGSQLAIRNFRFLRAENDVNSLPVSPTVKPGDMLWARFDIAGFRHGEKNRLDVSYGVAMRDQRGKVLFAEPTAAGDKDESFYPKMVVPGVISVHLERTIKPGDYEIVITATDAIGGQKTEATFPFLIR